MISFKIQNWKMLRSHNTHVALIFRGHMLAKVYTHRYYRAGKMIYGVDSRDTIKSIKNIGLCGFGIKFQWRHKKCGFFIGGDSEYMLPNRKHRKLFRFKTGHA